MKGAQEEIAGRPCLLQSLDQLAPPPKRQALSRPWENVCCRLCLPRRHSPLSADLSEEMQGQDGKKKALLIFYLLLLGPQGEADHTHQSRRNGINFLI